MVRGGLGRRGICAALACGLLGALAIPATASADAVPPCVATSPATVAAFPPPGTDTLQPYLADPDCNPIVLSTGTYTDMASTFTVNRAVTIAGAGAGQTILTRSGAGNVLDLTGGPASISGLTLSGATSGSGLLVDTNGEGTLSGAVIDSNNSTSTTGGGGVTYKSSKTVTISNSAITGNTSVQQGGGVLNGGTSTLNLVRDLIAGNFANGLGATVGGGGFSATNTGATTNFKNVTLTNNHAKGGGGGVRVGTSGSTTDLNNVTIAANFADDDNDGTGDGGGIENAATAVLNISNSIVANNTDRGGEADDCKSSMTTPVTRQGYELIEEVNSLCVFGGIGDTTTGYQTAIDPLLGPLANNGGITQTMELLQGSPAISAGNPATPDGTGTNCESIDQRSESRTSVTPCDLGAVEVQRAACSNIFRVIGAGQATGVQLSCSGRDPFNYALVSGPANGSLSGFNAATGAVTYTPNAGFTGLDSFSYRAINGPPSDPDAVSSTNATVTFQVNAPPAGPTTTTGSGSTFNLKAAIKRCKRKYPKGNPKRKKCIKNAKKKAAAG